jgi:SnoaL-like domain
MRGIRDVYEQARKFYNDGDLEGLANCYTEDAVLVSPDGTAQGRAAIREQWGRDKAAFPERGLTVEVILDRGDTLATEFNWVATNTGPLGLPDGTELPPGYWQVWLRREAPCCIPGLAGRNLEDIPGSDGLLKIRKVKGTIACQETSGRADAYGRRAGKTRVIWLKLYCLNPNLQ